MSRKNQPYLPLYVQDFMTDEKLAECSAESTGVYIRLMCLFHKSDPYGMILLKQKDKQTNKQIENFCLKLVKHLPYSFEVIHRSLTELISEDVLQIDKDKLFQKRMVKDADKSEKRSVAGRKGGKKTQEKDGFAQAKSEISAQAKSEANTEIENEIDIDNDNNGIKKYKYYDIENEALVLINSFTSNDDLRKSIMDFVEHRKVSVPPALTFRALQLFLMELKDTGVSEQEQARLLNRAISGGWKTIYPPRASAKEQDDYTAKVARGEINLD